MEQTPRAGENPGLNQASRHAKMIVEDYRRCSSRSRSAAALSPKKRGRLPAERPGGIRCFVVGAMHFNNHCTGLSTIVNGNCRAARPAPPPNKRMNPTLLFFELTNALRQRKSQTFHHSSARPARRVIRRAVGRLESEILLGSA